MTTKIFLIRHGESEWNRLHRYTGQRDVPLSDCGKQQAQRLARRLEHETLEAIYASPLQRARDTANAIGKVKRLPVRLEAGLAEICHGEWEGLTAPEVVQKFPEVFNQWRTQPQLAIMPQGESLDQVAQRSSKVFEQIIARHHNQTIAVCSHDAVIRVLLLIALDLPFDHFWKWDFENASLSMIEVNIDAPGARLAFLNDTTHLNGTRSDHTNQAL